MSGLGNQLGTMMNKVATKVKLALITQAEAMNLG
jgi:hypothetical protein